MNDFMRREALAKFGGKCGYCGIHKGKTVDHIRPLTSGGWDWPDNLLPACKVCNNLKGSMTLEQFRVALFQVREFGILPHKKTAASSAGQRWVQHAKRFQGPRITFYYEAVLPPH
jgi:5-methylcytosine-specific restriction endonuclease McrA